MHKIGFYIAILILIGMGGLVNTAHGQSFIDTACVGETGAVYRISPNAGSSYYWTVEDGAISSIQSNGSVITVDWGLIPGTKKITVLEVSGNGCHGDTVAAYVLLLKKGLVNILGPDQVCNGEMATLIATGGADRYEWSTGSNTPTIIVYPKADTTFMVTGYFGECGSSVSLYDLQVKYKPKADFNFTPDEPLIDNPVQFEYTGTPNVDNWNWTFEEKTSLLGQSSLENPQYSFDNAGIKIVKLFVSNTFGCTDTVTKYIVIKAGINVFIPSAFTPNQDGLNGIFIPVYENIVSAKMLIYNRWGELVFTTERMDEGWDGSFKGVPCPDGVFLFVVQVVGKDHNNYVFDGTVTLLR